MEPQRDQGAICPLWNFKMLLLYNDNIYYLQVFIKKFILDSPRKLKVSSKKIKNSSDQLSSIYVAGGLLPKHE
jgi:hypothetical protein